MPAPRHDNFQGLHKYADGSWGIDCFLHGKRVRRKVGKLSEARDHLKELKAAEKLGLVEVTPRSVRRKTLGEWADQYVAISKGATDDGFTRRWKERVGHLYPEQLKLEHVRAWAHQRLESGLAVASVHRELGTLSAIYGEALRSGEITLPQSPFRDLKALSLPKIKNQRQQYLRPQAVEATSKALGLWWPYAEFAILTGMRFGNQAGLRWPDIDWLSQLAHLWDTKGDKQFSVELCDRAIALLHGQRQLWEEKSEWCWPNSRGGQLDSAHFRQRVWRPAFKAAGLVDFHWHDLRHTTATWMAQNSIDLFTVQGVLDHADHRTTQRYAKHCRTRGRAGLEVVEKLLTGVSNASVSLEKGEENCLPVTI